jgi:Lon-like ATP-dependent protease
VSREKELRQKIRAIHREMVVFAVGHLIAEIRHKYKDLPKVISFLEAIEKDVIENIDEICKLTRGPETALPFLEGTFEEVNVFNRYRVNVFVDRSKAQGAPVVDAVNPIYPNLIGRIDHVSRMGILLRSPEVIDYSAA